MGAKCLLGAIALTILPVLPSSASTTYVYDNLGRVWTVTYDNGLQIVYSYDTAGNRTSVVTQTGTNRPPQANNDYVAVVTNTQTPSFYPLANDVDPDGDALSITALGATTQGGTTTLTGNAVKYTPPVTTPPFQGLDTFAYTISDGHGHTASGTVYASVSSGTPPIAVDDSAKTPLNTDIAALDVLANDTEPDPPGYDLTISSVTSPTAGGGTVVIDGPHKHVSYTPAQDFEGPDTFSYTITDGHQQYASAQVSVFVGAPPIANDDYQPVPLNAATTWNPMVNDSDPAGFPLSITGTGATAHGGVVAINNSGLALTYTPASGYSGPDTFTYTVSNGHGLDATAMEHVCVGTQPPVANPNTLEIAGTIRPQDPPFYPQGSIDPRQNDSDPCGSGLTVTGVTQGTKGSVQINLSGPSVTYTYNTSIHGVLHTTDSFTYTITNAFGATATASVTVNLDYEYNG